MSIAEFNIEHGGTTVQVIVYDYEPAEDMRVTGWGFGDAEPGRDELIDYRVLEDGEEFHLFPHDREFFENLIRKYLGEDDYGI